MRLELQMISFQTLRIRLHRADGTATEPNGPGFSFACRVSWRDENQMRSGVLSMPASEAARCCVRNIEKIHVFAARS